MMKKYNNNKLKWIGYVTMSLLLCLLFTFSNVNGNSSFEEIEVGDYLFLKSKLLPKKDSKNSDIIKEKRVKVVTKNMTHITVRNDNTCVNYDRNDIDNGRIKYIHEKSPFDRSRRVIMTYFIGFVIMPCYFYCGWQLFDILIYKFEHFENMKLVFKVIMGLGIIACFLRGFFYFLLWLPSFQFKCPSQLYIWLLEIPTMCTLICAFLFFHYIPSDVIVSDDYANLRIEEIDTAINILEMERVNLENGEFGLYRTLIYSTSYDISEMTDSYRRKIGYLMNVLSFCYLTYSISWMIGDDYNDKKIYRRIQWLYSLASILLLFISPSFFRVLSDVIPTIWSKKYEIKKNDDL